MKNSHVQEKKEVSEVQACPKCGNQYLVIWLTKNVDYKDFGERFCPFCRLVTQLFHVAVE